MLARRVGWLDRHRRRVAVASTLLLSPLVLLRVGSFLGPDWPRFHVVMISCVLGFAIWVVTETILVWFTAVWETECAHLMRRHAVPPAIVHRRRRGLFRK